MTKNSQQAFTLVELLVGLVIGAIIILAVGVISSISIGSYEKIRKEARVYNDIYYGFNLMKHACRNSQSVAVASNTLTFVDYNDVSKTFRKNNTDFVYTDSAGDHTIISGVNNLAFDFRCDKNYSSTSECSTWIPNSCSNIKKEFCITLAGEKDKVKFNLYTDVTRRN